MKLEYKKMVYVIRYYTKSKYRYMIRNMDKTSSGYHYFDKMLDALNYCECNNLEVIAIRN